MLWKAGEKEQVFGERLWVGFGADAPEGMARADLAWKIPVREQVRPHRDAKAQSSSPQAAQPPNLGLSWGGSSSSHGPPWWSWSPMWPRTQAPPPFAEGSPFKCPFPLIPLSLPFLWSSPSANKHALESPMKKSTIPSRYFCIYLILSSQESLSKELHTLAPSPFLLPFAPSTFVPSTPPFRRSCQAFRTQHTDPFLYPIFWSSSPICFYVLVTLPVYLHHYTVHNCPVYYSIAYSLFLLLGYEWTTWG